MASRRRPDTSKMFMSMTGHTEQEEEKSESKIKAEDNPEKEVSSPEKKSDSKPVKQRKKRSPKKERTDDPQDRQTVKLGFYLTPRVYEAIQLYKSIHFIGAHNDSQIVNKALSEFLKEEIAALQSVENAANSEERMRKASAILLSSDRHN